MKKWKKELIAFICVLISIFLVIAGASLLNKVIILLSLIGFVIATAIWVKYE